MKPSKIYIAVGLCFSLSLAASLGVLTAHIPAESVSRETGTAQSGEIPEAKILPVIVIDAGHGGFDGGAEAADGTQEKNINLAIAEQVKVLAAEYQVETVMIREGDYGLYEADSPSWKRDDLENRKKVMEDAEAALTVSIHLNSFPQNKSVYGAQVFYASKDGEPDDTVRKIAETVQAALEESIPDGGTRTAMKKSDVYLMKRPPCNFILVECGFLSNGEEAESLKSAEYQQILAEAVWKGICESLCLDVKKHVPVIDSANR